MFRALRAVPGYRRVSEILEEMIEDPDPLLRLGAATAVGECARSPLGWISQRVAKRTLTAASDPDWHVRDEVAHALPKIARKYRNMVNDCVETLKRLQEADSAPQVKERARTSLKDMDSLTFLE